MSKLTLAVLVIINFVLAGFVGFLAWQVSELRNDAHTAHTKEQTAILNTQKINTDLEALRSDLTAQKEALTEFSATVATLSSDLKKQLSGTFVNAPRPEIDIPIYRIAPAGDTATTVTGDRKLLQEWMERNELYRDYIFSKSVTLNQMPDGLVLQDVKALSLFAQMGFMTGDKILSINGKVIKAPADFFSELAKPENAGITLMRGANQHTLSVSYTDPAADEVAIPLTMDQFQSLLPRLFNDFRIAPAMQDGKTVGVKVVEINPTNPFSLMRFKGEDVITAIDGKPVTPTNFSDTLKTAVSPMVVDFIREQTPQKVTVRFQE